MLHRRLSLLFVILVITASLLAALPAAAEVYTIRLSNGSTFESRYQPKQAAWDASLVTFVDETGTEIALPQSLVTEVVPQSEQKGYGRVLNTTTVDLGFMPNDLDRSQQVMAQQAALNPQGQLVVNPAGGAALQQFVEPNAIGNGIPMGFNSTNSNFNVPVGAPGGFTGTPGTTPAPFTTPTNTVTPAPFTIPSPGTAAPPTTTTTTPQ
ncbi:MAG TPA: hypothetical protein VGS57_06765 [Thermoanaerobaculia bacterium]|jgi:hypothetical protein|nr:hypothetical protein [Thermoanaerobaculia bacterium]